VFMRLFYKTSLCLTTPLSPVVTGGLSLGTTGLGRVHSVNSIAPVARKPLSAQPVIHRTLESSCALLAGRLVCTLVSSVLQSCATRKSCKRDVCCPRGLPPPPSRVHAMSASGPQQIHKREGWQCQYRLSTSNIRVIDPGESEGQVVLGPPRGLPWVTPTLAQKSFQAAGQSRIAQFDH
jgi:hypothetical protein